MLLSAVSRARSNTARLFPPRDATDGTLYFALDAATVTLYISHLGSITYMQFFHTFKEKDNMVQRGEMRSMTFDCGAIKISKPN